MTNHQQADSQAMDSSSMHKEVMGVPTVGEEGPLKSWLDEVIFGQIWTRPGLSRRDRRFVTLACVAAADVRAPLEQQVYAALSSGDISFAEMTETVLHFAVYCGWPKASLFQEVVDRQWQKIHGERGEPVPEPEGLNLASSADTETRLVEGARAFNDINLTENAPPRTAPYYGAGILNFVFGEVWQRPDLGCRERRLITLACVALDDTPIPIQAHAYGALASGDTTWDEMQEVILQIAAYSGWPKASHLAQKAREQQDRVESERRAGSLKS